MKLIKQSHFLMIEKSMRFCCKSFSLTFNLMIVTSVFLSWSMKFSIENYICHPCLWDKERLPYHDTETGGGSVSTHTNTAVALTCGFYHCERIDLYRCLSNIEETIWQIRHRSHEHVTLSSGLGYRARRGSGCSRASCDSCMIHSSRCWLLIDCRSWGVQDATSWISATTSCSATWLLGSYGTRPYTLLHRVITRRLAAFWRSKTWLLLVAWKGSPS